MADIDKCICKWAIKCKRRGLRLRIEGDVLFISLEKLVQGKLYYLGVALSTFELHQTDGGQGNGWRHVIASNIRSLRRVLQHALKYQSYGRVRIAPTRHE